jgi:hypothetical protein
MYRSLYISNMESEAISNISKRLINYYGYDYENAVGAVANAAADVAKQAAKEISPTARAAGNMFIAAGKRGYKFKEHVLLQFSNNKELVNIANQHNIKTLNDLGNKIISGEVEVTNAMVKPMADLIISLRKSERDGSKFKRALGWVFGNNRGGKNLDRIIEEYSELMYKDTVAARDKLANELAAVKNELEAATNNVNKEVTNEVAKDEKKSGKKIGRCLLYVAGALGIGAVGLWGGVKLAKNDNTNQE